MNGSNNIIKQLGFDSALLSMQEVVSRYPTYRDLERLEVDACYFIAGHPAALFCKVDAFDDAYSKRVARILHKAWNYQKVLLLITYSDFEVRVYNCYTRPTYVAQDAEYEKEIKDAQIGRSSLRDSDLGTFISYFSKEALDTGALWQAHEKTVRIDVTESVDAYLVDSLERTKKRLLENGLEERYIHSLLIRSLFVLFLEDKGATAEAGIYESIIPGVKSYLDILKDKNATYRLFDVLNQQFNGDITHQSDREREVVEQRHLDVIRKCFIDGDLSDNPKMFGDWRLFHFDIIRIELLSEIYEHFLGASKASKGQYYTPLNLVNLILDEKIPTNSKHWDIKVLDPSCGSGIFLVESYKRLIGIWKRENHTSSIDFQTLKRILCKNIYGIDIDGTALSVTAFSLYLTLINELDPRTLWADPSNKLPCLIHSGNERAEVEGNLWCTDTIGTDLTEQIPVVDLVVGNPPYGTKHDQDSISDYCKRNGFADEMSLPFMHKLANLCPNGEIALVVNMKILTNTNGTYVRFRDWLFRTAYVEKIYNFSIFRMAPANYGGSLFKSAKTPVAVIFYKASRPQEESKSITYWAPRTYVKSNVLYDIVLDSCDVKSLPREMCEANDISVWKVGAWGNAMAYRIIEKLKARDTLQTTFGKNGWVFGRGCNADSKRPDFTPNAIINLNKIGRYVIDRGAVFPNERRKAYRNNKPGLYNPPFVVMKECPDKDGVIAGIFGSDAVSTTSTFVFNGMDNAGRTVLTAYLNSKLANTYLFLTSSTWGIERERLVLEDEVMLLPSPFATITSEQKEAVVSAFKRITEMQTGSFDSDTERAAEIANLDKLFYGIFGLTEQEIEVIEDVYNNSFKLFVQKSKADAMKKNTRDGLNPYAERLCRTLNDYYQFSETRVRPEVLVPHVTDSLCMVVVRFGKEEQKLHLLDSQEDRILLGKLYRMLTSKPGDGIVVQRVLRDYQSDSIILIKPNQRRYWTEMQALEDGASIFSEILAMKEQRNG